MAKPVTREEFKQYCLRKLGAPVIQINVADDQLEDRIDEALTVSNNSCTVNIGINNYIYRNILITLNLKEALLLFYWQVLNYTILCVKYYYFTGVYG